MTSLSNFILNIDYQTKTFKVVQEFMISNGLRVNNPIFSELPLDQNNYEDIFPIEQKNTDLNKNLNINGELMNNNNNNTLVNIHPNLIIPNNNNYINNNRNNINNTDNNLNIPNNNINENNNIPNFNHPRLFGIHRRIIPPGIANRIGNNILIPINPHPLPHHIVNRVHNNPHLRRRKYLISLVPLPNDDLLAISNKECWIMRKNSIKYNAFTDNIITNCRNIIMVKKALSISETEFVIEIEIPKYLVKPNKMIINKIKTNNLLFIFFNLNYEEICRKNLFLCPTVITYDNNYIYINDTNSIVLMNKKNKEIINILQVNSLGTIIPIKSNNSFIIQEKENNAIVEYRIIENEIVRGDQIISNKKIKLMSSLDDNWNTLIFKYNDFILFIQ